MRNSLEKTFFLIDFFLLNVGWQQKFKKTKNILHLCWELNLNPLVYEAGTLPQDQLGKSYRRTLSFRQVHFAFGCFVLFNFRLAQSNKGLSFTQSVCVCL